MLDTFLQQDLYYEKKNLKYFLVPSPSIPAKLSNYKYLSTYSQQRGYSINYFEIIVSTDT